MKFKMYGIPNCDTVKKVRTFLDQIPVQYEFVDFKKTAPTKADIQRWEKFFGELPANKKGPTFRKIKEDYEKGSVEKQIEFLIKNSSAIKRPILEKDGQVVCIGYDEALLRLRT